MRLQRDQWRRPVLPCQGNRLDWLLRRFASFVARVSTTVLTAPNLHFSAPARSMGRMNMEPRPSIAARQMLPKDAKGPVPVLMSFGWTPFDLERFNFNAFRRPGIGPRPPSKRDMLIAAGWGCATLNPSTVQDDSGGWQPRRFGPGADPNAVANRSWPDSRHYWTHQPGPTAQA